MIEKEDIILIQDAAIVGHIMTQGARYNYIHEWTDKEGIFHESVYICGTNVMQERYVDWTLFIKAGKYTMLLALLKEELKENSETRG